MKNMKNENLHKKNLLTKNAIEKPLIFIIHLNEKQLFNFNI